MNLQVNDVVTFNYQHRRKEKGYVFKLLENDYVDVKIDDFEFHRHVICKKSDLKVIDHVDSIPKRKIKRAPERWDDINKGAWENRNNKPKGERKPRTDIRYTGHKGQEMRARVDLLMRNHKVLFKDISKELEYSDGHLRKVLKAENLTKTTFERLDKGLLKIESRYKKENE